MKYLTESQRGEVSMQPDVLKNRIAAGRGDVCADLVLKNARVINVFTNEIETIL